MFFIPWCFFSSDFYRQFQLVDGIVYRKVGNQSQKPAIAPVLTGGY